MKNHRPLQLAVLALLERANNFDWSVQGFGVLRHYIGTIGRLHIWDSRLRYPGVSMIHTHSWDLRSTIVSGELCNTIYTEVPGGGLPYHKQRLITGYMSHMVTPMADTRLVPWSRTVLVAGEIYQQRASEIHQTNTINGTITLMERREDENGEADVYWPHGTEWGTATPRRVNFVKEPTVCQIVHEARLRLIDELEAK